MSQEVAAVVRRLPVTSKENNAYVIRRTAVHTVAITMQHRRGNFQTSNFHSCKRTSNV